MVQSEIAASKNLDPLEYVLMLMTFAAGSVDVISFVKLGEVFASAMTGNIAFLALHSAAGSIYSAIGSLIALCGFAAGAAAGALLSRDRPARGAIMTLVSSETILLLGAALLWLALPQFRSRLFAYVVILILSLAMGLQSICGKKINLSNIPTVVFTSTLTNIVLGVTESLSSRKALAADSKRQLVSFSMYFVGAFCAGLLCLADWSILILLPLIAVASALVIHILRQS